MGITMIVTGRLGKPERPSFFIPKGALTHHRAACPAVVLLLRISRALCEADCALFGARQTIPPSLRALVVIACTAGRSVFVRFAASPQTVVLCRDNLPPACDKAATAQGTPFGCGSFVAVMDDATSHRPFSFVSVKETKPPLVG